MLNFVYVQDSAGIERFDDNQEYRIPIGPEFQLTYAPGKYLIRYLPYANLYCLFTDGGSYAGEFGSEAEARLFAAALGFDCRLETEISVPNDEKPLKGYIAGPWLIF